jgi:hypothetical protein
LSKKYDTFAAYLEDVYYNQIFSKIKSYLYNNQGRLDLSTSAVPDPSYVELSDFKIMESISTSPIQTKLNARLLFVRKLKSPDVAAGTTRAI